MDGQTDRPTDKQTHALVELIVVTKKSILIQGASNPNAWREWNQAPLCRTRGSIARERGRLRGKPQFSVKNHPISTLPAGWDDPIINSVPEDILHLRVRVGEKLMTNCVSASADHTKNKLVPGLQSLIRSAGVPFKVSETLVHGTNRVVFNTLTGRHWRMLLPQLPSLIRTSTDVFADSHKEPIANLVEQFVSILTLAANCPKSEAEKLAGETSAFLNAFLDLGRLGLKGFSSNDVTPYVHWMHAHLPYTVSLFGGISKFSGELLEAQNDEIKKTHARRSHCKDPKLTLLMEKRRELQLMEHEIEEKNKIQRRRKEGPQHPW